MKYFTSLFILTIGINALAQKDYDYPNAPKDPTTNIYFEETIADPYQWMEDPQDNRLQEWLEEQENFTSKLSNKQTHYYHLRSQIGMMYRTRREKTEDYEEGDIKIKDKYDFKKDWNGYTNAFDYLYKLSDKKNWIRLFRGRDLLENKDDHLLIGQSEVNEKENLLAVALSINGSDWATGYIFDLTTGKQLPYTIENIRTGGSFGWNGRDLYYKSYNKPATGRELLDTARGEKLFRLSINSSLSTPELLYNNPDTTGTNKFYFDIKNERLRLYHHLQSKGTWFRAISIADLTNENFVSRRLLVYPSDDATELEIAYTQNDSIFLKTNIGAPNGKVLLANLNTPNKLSEFIPEYDIDLQYVNKLGKNKLACVYLKAGQNIALIFNMKGELLRKIDFPKGKKLNHFYEYANEADFTTFSLSSFFHENTRYQINLDNLEFQPSESLSVPYDIENLETRYITYTSKDGTEVSMYLTCEKDIVLDGTNPVLMHGYGGYGTTVEPFYQASTALFLAHGGILAVPNIRGGGAKGGDWAMEGRRLKKQNAIDDFVAAGEYLIDQNYTKPEKLAISGKSHGALLVEAAATQRPELFQAVIAEAGPYDMLRFNNFTAGGVATNLNEFGNVNKPEDYKNLKSYSPLHNLQKDIEYPNTLLITGDTDDRVPPHHSYKFTAALQELGNNSKLYHLYVTPGSGHGGALAPEDYVEQLVYEYYFLFDQLDIRFF